jgi:hypothetical protein
MYISVKSRPYLIISGLFSYLKDAKDPTETRSISTMATI